MLDEFPVTLISGFLKTDQRLIGTISDGARAGCGKV